MSTRLARLADCLSLLCSRIRVEAADDDGALYRKFGASFDEIRALRALITGKPANDDLRRLQAVLGELEQLVASLPRASVALSRPAARHNQVRATRLDESARKLLRRVAATLAVGATVAAAVPTLANTACTDATTTRTCTGDQSTGIFVDPISGITNLVIKTLNKAITPPATVFGVNMQFTGAGGTHNGAFSDGTPGDPGRTFTVDAQETTFGITTTGASAHGIAVFSTGGEGGNGGNAVVAGNGGDAGNGGAGGGVTITNHMSVATSGDGAHGLYALSLGGHGGSGGDSKGLGGNGGDGGVGGNGGAVTITNVATVSTTGKGSVGILGQSLSGASGSGGDGGGIVAFGGGGGNAGVAGTVILTNSGTLTTTGDLSYGMQGTSVGGFAGSGGSGKGIAGFGAGGSGGGNAGNVTLTNSGIITTSGALAHGMYGQSIGGGGGDGGGSGGLFSSGGDGGAGGNGATTTITNTGTIHVSGAGAHGIFAESVGGYGGAGGDSLGIGVVAAITLGGTGGPGGDGGTVNVTNAGTIVSDGGRGIFAQSVGGTGGSGGDATSISAGAFISASVAIGGKGGGGGKGGAVAVANTGTIQVNGDQFDAVYAESTGGGGGKGGAAYSIAASVGKGVDVAVAISVGGSGGNGGDGGIVSVINSGAILSYGSDSRGVYAHSVGGGGGDGGSSTAKAFANSVGGPAVSVAASVAVGGTGGMGGDGGAVNVLNTGTVSTFGLNSIAVFGYSVGGGGGNGGDASVTSATFLAKTSAKVNVAVGGRGGAAGDGGVVTITNTGTIATMENNSIGIKGQSVGGGGGTGGAGTTAPLSEDFELPENIDAANVANFLKTANKQSLINDGKAKFTSLKTEARNAKNSPLDYAKKSLKDTLGKRPEDIQVSISVGGAGGAAGNGSTVLLTNSGSIITAGVEAYGVLAQSVGGGGGTGGGGTAESKGDLNVGGGFGGTGGSNGNGGIVTVLNSGSIQTFGQISYGIMAQSVGGGGGIAETISGQAGTGSGGTAGGSAEGLRSLSLSIGGRAGSTGNGDVVSITQTGDITTWGASSTAIFAQSIGGGGGNGGAATAASYLNVSVGAGGGSGGNGGAVNITVNGNITTAGDTATGILAQSIGGGGGSANGVVAKTLEIGLAPFGTYKVDTGVPFAIGAFGVAGSGGGGGNGGAIKITGTGDILTIGRGSDGIFAQSIGGGGGHGGSIDPTIIPLPVNNASGGVGAGGTVTIDYTGNIRAGGADANGIVAQTLGGDLNHNIIAGGDISITVGGAVQGGSGGASGIVLSGGATDTITIKAAGAVSSLAGNAIIAGIGNETINNSGVVSGNVGLGGGANTFNNLAGATFEPGATNFIGTGATLTNAGALSPRGTTAGTVQFGGNITQTASGVFQADVNLTTNKSDLMTVDGTVSLNGTAVFGPHHASDLKAGYMTVLKATSLTNAGIAIADTLVVDYGVKFAGNDFQMGVNSINFVPTGLNLSGNAAAVGNSLNTIVATGTTNDLTPLLDYMSTLTSPSQFSAIITSLDPSGSTAQWSAQFANATHSADSLMSCPGSTDPADALHEHECAWIRATTGSPSQDARPGTAGYDSHGWGTQIGGQLMLEPGWFLGATGGYHQDWIRTDSGGVGRGHAYNVGFALKHEIGDLTLAFGADYDIGRSHFARPVLFPVGSTASSLQSQRFLDVRLRAAYVLYYDDFYLKPSVDLDLYRASLPGFAETGAGAFGVETFDMTKVYGSGTAGLEVGSFYRAGENWTVRPYLSGGITAFTDDKWSMEARLIGAPIGSPNFIVTNRFPGLLGRVAAGVEASYDNATIRAEFEDRMGRGYNDPTGTMKVELRF